MFQREMLCTPVMEKDLYFEKQLVAQHSKEKKPTMVDIEGLKFYKFSDDENREMPMVYGVDTGSGSGRDANTFVLTRMQDNRNFSVIASAESNKIPQSRFAELCIRYMALNVHRPKRALGVVEANYGDGAISAFHKEKFRLYRRMNQKYDDHSTNAPRPTTADRRREQYGLWRGAGNKNTLLHTLKMQLENGTICITDKRILNEVYTATNLDITKSNIRRAQENLTTLSIDTQHFDFIAALVCVAWGINTIKRELKHEAGQIPRNPPRPEEVYRF